MLDSRWFLFISFGCITHKSVTVSIQICYAIGEMNEAGDEDCSSIVFQKVCELFELLRSETGL